MTHQQQVPDWWGWNDRDPPPIVQRTAVVRYYELVESVELASANLAAVTTTTMEALRVSYRSALEATAVLPDPTGEQREIKRAMRRLRQRSTPRVASVAKELLET